MEKTILPIIETKKATSQGVLVGHVPEALKDIFRALEYDLLALTPDDKQTVAEMLSRVAHHQPAWGWRYVHNVLYGKIDASANFQSAILKLLAIVDGAHPLYAASKAVSVRAVGNVRPGSVILSDSRPCANPECPVWFVPKVPRQRFCSKECSKKKPSK